MNRMLSSQMEKIGDFDLRGLGSKVTQQQKPSPTPQKKQQKSEQKLLHLQSKIDHNYFCDHQDHLHEKCTKITRTKWDKFSPYSFHKLTKQQKDKTFLQLYEDYRGTKQKLNDEQDKYLKLKTKMHMLQQDFAQMKAKTNMPAADRLRFQKQRDEQTKSLKQEIKRLHQKIIALTGNNYKLGNTRPKTANKTKSKNIIPVNQNVRVELQQQRKHVRQLLLIIDELKKNKFQVQQQLKQKQANQSRVTTTNNKSKLLMLKNNNQSQFQEYANDLHNWKQKYNDLQMVYNQMNYDKDKKIKQLSADLINLKQNQRMKQRLQGRGTSSITDNTHLEQKIRQVTKDKERLQDEIRRLVQMPFYQNSKQIVDAQQKIVSLQKKYDDTKAELKKLVQTNTQYFTDLQFKTKQNTLIRTENDKMKKQLRQIYEKQNKKVGSQALEINYDDYYRKMLALVKLQGEDPIWKKYQAMAKPEFNLMTEDKIRNLAQNLWLNKLQLLAHLQKAQIQLKTLKQNMDSRINIYIRDKQEIEQELKMTRARLDQWKCMDNINQNKIYKVYEQAGIKYDDSTSVFQIDEKQFKELQSNENYFDLYLGHLNIDEGVLMKNPSNKIKNTTHFISFLTIDFYNHETQHSNFAEGTMKKLGNNYSFKVDVNSYFLKYLAKNALSLELWSPQGTATVLLGKGQIYLSQLVSKAAQDIANVIRGKCQIYYNDKILLGTVQYRFRMRLPIYPCIQWAESKNEFNVSESKNPFSIGKRKTMEIVIQRAQGLPNNLNSFVYFTVQQQDFFTQPQRGSNPIWNFKQQVLVTMDEDFANNLKQKYFQFTIFDDEKEVNEDVFGFAKANFTPLIDQTNSLDLLLDIQDRNGQKRGKLKVKVQWLNF